MPKSPESNPNVIRHYLGIDTGGTFTDFVLLRDGALTSHKVPSTPDAPDRAIWQGIRDLELMDIVRQGHLTIIHGTTVATNAVLEASGVRTAYITNEGLADVLLIGRQTRRHLYDLTPAVPHHPFEGHPALEVPCRLTANGEWLTRLSETDIEQLKLRLASLGVESVAINLVFSYLDPSEEERIESALCDQYFVSRSSFVLPATGEFERGIATWINAWIGPLIESYMSSIATAVQPSNITIMQSSGLTISASQAGARAVNLLLSGPAGGIAAAALLARQTNRSRMLTFDMGGTSTDVSLVDGSPALIARGQISGLPIHVPMTDIHTIGAGGGSVAYVDGGGLLRVGPRSAGAVPGPACYGRGGQEPAVTDAHAFLGRLMAERFFGGQLPLDMAANRIAIQRLADQLGIPPHDVAQGIIDIANEHMVAALKVISIERGYDPRDFILTSFGGAGGLHVCEVAELLGMSRILIPRDAGVLSAAGMLATAPGREMIRTREQRLDDVSDETLHSWFKELEEAASHELSRETDDTLVFRRGLDLRYVGQTHTLEVAYRGDLSNSAERFQEQHRQRFGHRLERPVELCDLRINARARRSPLDAANVSPKHHPPTKADPSIPNKERITTTAVILNGHAMTVPVFTYDEAKQLDGHTGPLIIADKHTTVLVRPEWSLSGDEHGHLYLKRHEA